MHLMLNINIYIKEALRFFAQIFCSTRLKDTVNSIDGETIRVIQVCFQNVMDRTFFKEENQFRSINSNLNHIIEVWFERLSLIRHVWILY